MSAFYIGQRVKKVRGDPRNHGLLGAVEGVDGCGFLLVRIQSGAGFTNTGFLALPGEVWPSPPDHWEPILPPGLESLEEINALYEPSPIEVRA